MAFGINDFDGGTSAPDVNYPYGDVYDDPGGTRVNRKSMDDIWQYFQKVMDLAQISPNHTADNFGNGYQFVDALQTLICPSFDATGCVFQSVGLNTWGNIGAPYADFAPKLDNGITANEVTLRGVVSITAIVPGTIPIVQLGNSLYFPTGTRLVATVARYGATYVPTILTIDNTGLISVDSAVTAGAVVFFDGVTYSL